ncbi:MAG: hypothetical protein OXT03_05900 [Alphaproteobacteria bacterium]|nr:hypothetical protein [Alphaproteobacteria bacterium]
MLDAFSQIENILTRKGAATIHNVPDGFIALLLEGLARRQSALYQQEKGQQEKQEKSQKGQKGKQAKQEKQAKQGIIYVASDARRMNELQQALQFFAPDLPVIMFPAWDCLPYDRIAPNAAICAARMTALAQFIEIKQSSMPYIVLTTANAITQYVPPREVVSRQSFALKLDQKLAHEKLIQFLIDNGYTRASLVMEQGDFAIRGGIIDLFPPGAKHPVRLDFFGDRLEKIRLFEAETQQTISPQQIGPQQKAQCESLILHAASEIRLDKPSIARFRKKYIAAFGAPSAQSTPDPLYEAIKAGSRYAGMEHYLPLFHEKLETLFDYLPNALLIFDHLAENAISERSNQVQDYYQARCDILRLEKDKNPNIIKPLPPAMLYLDEDKWQALLAKRDIRTLSPFDMAEKADSLSAQVKPAYNFAAERAQENINLFDALINHIKILQKQGKRVILVSRSDDARARLASL